MNFFIYFFYTPIAIQALNKHKKYNGIKQLYSKSPLTLSGNANIIGSTNYTITDTRAVHNSCLPAKLDLDDMRSSKVERN